MPIHWTSLKPAQPAMGDVYVDRPTYTPYIWEGSKWIEFSAESQPTDAFTIPTEEQLSKHPSLKYAWEEFLIIKRLLGI